MTKERTYFLDTHAWREVMPLPNKDGSVNPGAWYVRAEDFERLDADAAGAQAELASVKACWAEALGNVATRNREIEQLRRERHQLRNELTAARLENQQRRALLVEVYNHGENSELHGRIGAALGAAPGEDASPVEPGAGPVVSPSHSLIALYAGCLCEWCKSERAKSALKSVSAHLPNQAQWCQDPDCPMCASQRTSDG